MGRKVKPREKIMQKSIGFHMRQHQFFGEHPDFKPDQFCREAIDEQIKQIDEEFLSEDENERD